jgi:ABC-type nitrate/sulfonate/bicarbonate transport system substrate-binding protein
MTRSWLKGAAVLGLAGWLAACGAAAPATGRATTGASGTASAVPGSGTPTRVSLMLDWYPNGDHAGIYAAAAQGYERAQGIQVDIQVPADPTSALKAVAAGKVDFAVSYEPEVLLARAQGLPVVAVMAMVQRPLNSIIALPGSGITRPRDLVGKRVGTDGLQSTQDVLDTVLRADGVDPRQVTTVDVSEDNVAALLAHKVDAIVGAYWNWEAVEIQGKDGGRYPDVMRVDDWGVPSYDELVLVTSDRLAQTEPDLVRRFVAAEVAGETYAKDNPDGAVRDLLAANKDLDSTLVSRSVHLLQPVWQADAPAVGVMDARQWSSYEQWMQQQGLLDKAVPIAEAMTDRFLPKGSGG